MKRTLTDEQREAQAQRRAKFRALCKQIADMDDGQRAALAARVVGIVTCEGHGLSIHNIHLLALQCPSATVVGGFRQWLKLGRCVRQGQHGYTIWAPIGKRASAGDESATLDNGQRATDQAGFIPVTVFDVAQTDDTMAGELAVIS